MAKKESKKSNSTSEKLSKKNVKTVVKPKKQVAGNNDVKANTKKSSQPRRYFKAIYESQGEVVCRGRYRGKKPKQAACKALTAITNEMKDRGEDYLDVVVGFSVIEQTRGSKNKKYYYDGRKFVLDEEVEVDITKKDKVTGEEYKSKVFYKKGSEVKKCSGSKYPELMTFSPKKEDLEDLDEEEEEQEGGKKETKGKSSKKTTKASKTVKAKSTKSKDTKVTKKDTKKATKKETAEETKEEPVVKETQKKSKESKASKESKESEKNESKSDESEKSENKSKVKVAKKNTNKNKKAVKST